jgi:hypothetical protein
MSLTLKNKKIITLQTKNAIMKKKTRLRISTARYADQKELIKFRVQKCCTSKEGRENI